MICLSLLLQVPNLLMAYVHMNALANRTLLLTSQLASRHFSIGCRLVSIGCRLVASTLKVSSVSSLGTLCCVGHDLGELICSRHISESLQRQGTAGLLARCPSGPSLLNICISLSGMMIGAVTCLACSPAIMLCFHICWRLHGAWSLKQCDLRKRDVTPSSALHHRQ